MKTVTITLDETEYQVEELRSRANAAWRAQLETHFEELAQALDGMGALELANGAALGGLVRTVSGKLLRSVTLVGDLVVAYAPQLEEAREEAYDSELLDAFTQILSLAYPFGVILERARQLISQVG